MENSNSKTRWVVLLAGVGVALLAVASILFVSGSQATAGDVEAIEQSLSDPVLPSDLTQPGPVADTAPTTIVDDTPTIEPNEVDRLDELGSHTERVPIGLQIDAISVDAPVSPFGVDQRTGQMDVPNNVTEVAWYEFGPTPGDAGSAVLAAHVDLSNQGRGVFFELKELVPGQRVGVTYDDGSEQWFVVEARATYDKDELPLDTIFSREGAPVLTLITCGGGFSRSAQSYDGNVVVYAVPEGDLTNPAPEAA